MRDTWVPSLGWEDPLETRTATHSSILAWRIPWTLQVAKSRTQESDFHFHLILFFLFGLLKPLPFLYVTAAIGLASIA